MSNNYSSGNKQAFLELMVIAATGRFHSLEEAVEYGVNELGLRDCPCGEPDCETGRAIRAAYARRRNGQNAAPALTAEQIEEATYRGQVRAMEDFARMQREKSLGVRAWRLAGIVCVILLLGLIKLLKFVFTVVTTPYAIIKSAVKWRDLEQTAEGLHAFVATFDLSDQLTLDEVHNLMPWRLRLGYEVGKWTSGIRVSIVFWLQDLKASWDNFIYYELPNGLNKMITRLSGRKPTAAPAPAAAAEEPAAE